MCHALPADRGGGEIWTIVSAVLLSLLSSVIYDLAKDGGGHLIRLLRRLLSRKRIKATLDETMKKSDLPSTLRLLTEEEISQYFKAKDIRKLSDRELGKLLRIAVSTEAKEFRKELIKAAKKKGKHKQTT
jgi:hypothetical protein